MSSLYIKRTGKKVHYSIEKRLNGFIVKGRTTQHRHYLALNGTVPNRLAQIISGDLLLGYVLLHHIVVELRQYIYQCMTGLLGRITHVVWDLFNRPFFTQSLLPAQFFHIE